MTTLIDVARRAGVSKSTVSNVIRGDVRVARTTRAKVERAIKMSLRVKEMHKREPKSKTKE